MKKEGKTRLSKVGAQSLLEEEAQSIDHRYRPRMSGSILARLSTAKDIDLRKVADRCRYFDNLEFNASTLQEEQEQELSLQRSNRSARFKKRRLLSLCATHYIKTSRVSRKLAS